MIKVSNDKSRNYIFKSFMFLFRAGKCWVKPVHCKGLFSISVKYVNRDRYQIFKLSVV